MPSERNKDLRKALGDVISRGAQTWNSPFQMLKIAQQYNVDVVLLRQHTEKNVHRIAGEHEAIREAERVEEAARGSGIPDFNPRFEQTEGVGMYYEDDRVSGAVSFVEVDGQRCQIVIHEWCAHFPGHGHTVMALEWLREQGFTSIVANRVGLIEDGVGDIATAYWEHMHEKGLVDVLLDDNGADITPARAKPAMPSI